MRFAPAASAAIAFTSHSSFVDIAKRYDAFILDQFGVLHDGKKPLPGAPELIKHLSRETKPLVILSNTSSPADAALRRLPLLGFDPSDFAGAVTSGTEAGAYIRRTYGGERGGGARGEKTKKALWFTWEIGNSPSADPLDFLRLCGGVEIANTVNDADFIIAHGSGILRGPGSDDVAVARSLGGFIKTGEFDAIDPILRRCLERDLPMVCANPDFVVLRSDGNFEHMPGKIARRYEETHGGTVKYFGKPHPAHFEACLRELGVARDRVVHVGDSLAHDVAGAIGAGIDSVFVTGGIHSEELGGSPTGALPTEEALRGLFEREGVEPTHVVPMFRL